MNELHQLHSCRGGNQVLSLLTDIISFEQCFNDGSTGRRPADTILLQGITKFIIIHQFSGCFHCTEQCCFGIRSGRLCPFLVQVGNVRTTFTLHKGREYIFILFLFFFSRIFYVLCKHDTPSRFQDLFSGHPEFYLIHFSHDGSSRNLTVRIEYGYKTTGYQVIDTTFHIRQVLSIDSGGDNGVVIRHLRVVKYLFRFRKCSAG